ncbi:MAG: YrhB domain-containing protein [Arenimonas sp.]
MFDYNSAEKAVTELLAKVAQQIDIELVISDVIEQDFGWVFIYETLEHIESDNPDSSLSGSVPLIFDKSDGIIYTSEKASTLDAYLAQYRRGIRIPA